MRLKEKFWKLKKDWLNKLCCCDRKRRHTRKGILALLCRNDNHGSHLGKKKGSIIHLSLFQNIHHDLLVRGTRVHSETKEFTLPLGIPLLLIAGKSFCSCFVWFSLIWWVWLRRVLCTKLSKHTFLCTWIQLDKIFCFLLC